jgi:hypothetical protein
MTAVRIVHKFNQRLSLDKLAFVCIFYVTTAAEILLNYEKFEIL